MRRRVLRRLTGRLGSDFSLGTSDMFVATKKMASPCIELSSRGDIVNSSNWIFHSRNVLTMPVYRKQYKLADNKAEIHTILLKLAEYFLPTTFEDPRC